MTSPVTLTGRWVGHYLQGGKEYPIMADLVQSGEWLSGSMRDGCPDREAGVFEAAAEAGLPPGADEQIVAKLRELVPDAPAAPIRYVSHLPSESVLEGRFSDRTVYFLKTYQGTSFGGFKVGNRLVGTERAGHAVHYEGQLRLDGLVIEGRWWIEPDPEAGIPRSEGQFTLRRARRDTAPPQESPSGVQPGRPWWKFWSR
jgi:hypothetical protein